MSVTRTREEQPTGRWLTALSPEHAQRSAARATRMVSLVLVGLGALGLISTIVQWLNGSSVAAVYVSILAALAAIVIAFVLVRTDHVRAAGVLAASVPTLGGLAVVVADPSDPGWFAFMALNPLLGRLFLPLRWSAPMACLNYVVLLLAVTAVAGIDEATAVVAVVFNGIVLALFLAGAVYHEATDRERRRVAGERLRLAETILEGTFGGMVVLRRDVVVEANATFLAQFQLDGPSVIGQPVGRFFDTTALAIIDAAGARAESHPVEIEAMRLDGTCFDAEVLVRQTKVDGEEAVVLAVRDVTMRTLADAALRRAERTEATARLAAVVAHDANNELFVIKALSDELSRHHPGAGELTESVVQIEAAAGRAATLMHRVLRFERPAPDESHVVDVARFVEENLMTWRQVLGPDVALHVDPRSANGLIEIDSSKLARVMLNLVLNARDAIDGTGVVEIGVAAVTIGAATPYPTVGLPSGHYLRLTVHDTGAGIAEEHLPHAFDAFYTTKERSVGSGLGLYASRETVRDAGGEIVIESSDQGTTVSVYLRDLSTLTVGV